MKTNFFVPIAICISLLIAREGAPQARIESIAPDSVAFRVERLGSFEPETATVDMELLPGDVVTTDTAGSLLGLNCPPGSNNSYLVPGPFRVMIDVPGETKCRVNLLGGRVDVLAEEPTEVTSGGVEMGSVSTQYAVIARRGVSTLEQKVVVYDGEVRVRSRLGTTVANSSSSLAYDAVAGALEEVPMAKEEVLESARVYSQYDVAQATKAGVAISDSRQALHRLQELHYDVLTNPADTDKRVELAKAQIGYQVNNQALFNLKRANVANPEALQRYQIDPKVLEKNLKPVNRDYYQRVVVPRSTVREADTATTRLARSATDADLERIAAGDPKTALDSLLAREKRGQAGSRDYFAIAKAYLELKDARQARGFAERAQKEHEVDGQLSDRELGELKEILAQTRR